MQRSPSSTWNFLRDSPKLRGVLKYQIDAKDLSFGQVERDTGIRQDNMSKYFRGVKPSLSDYKILQLADYLGVEVSLTVHLKLPNEQ